MTDHGDTLAVYSDYVCPFCYLGRESLRRYQATRESPLRIDWRPFDLRAGQREPDGTLDPAVDDGKDEEYFRQVRENVERLADRYDVEMIVDVARDVDSLPAQVASAYVADEYDYGTWLAFDRAVFEALWREGADVGDAGLLLELVSEAGVDPDEVRAALDDDERHAELRDRFDRARRRGITGVPTFVYGDHAARGGGPSGTAPPPRRGQVSRGADETTAAGVSTSLPHGQTVVN
jgi:predicted DsbA family dithiol-disulfide isomerase